MYAVIAGFNSLKVLGRSRYATDFATPHRKKSGEVRSGEQRVSIAFSIDVFNKKNESLN
jgi:hypothetical protein